MSSAGPSHGTGIPSPAKLVMLVFLLLQCGVICMAAPFLLPPPVVCPWDPSYAVLPTPFQRPLFGALSQTVLPTNNNLATQVAQLANCTYLVYDPEFYNLVDVSTPLKVLATKSYSFAHEAGVYLKDTQQVLFTSNRLGDTSSSQQYIEVSLVSVVTGEVVTVLPNPPILMANGGTKYDGSRTVLLCSQGGNDTGGSLVTLNTATGASTTILNNWHGLKFNSPNDVVLHKDGTIWFTDPAYGYEQHFRDAPQLGNNVYVFNPATGVVSPVGDGFTKPNGLVFSPDFETLYISDSGFFEGTGAFDVRRPHAVYAFNVKGSATSGYQLRNKRLFSTSEVLIPDGVKVDRRGNLYVGEGDGANVYSPDGLLLGKILTGGAANLVFADDSLVMLQETRILSVPMKVRGAILPKA